MTTPAVVSIGSVPIGPGCPLALIAGPCVIEGRDFTLRHAERLKAMVVDKLRLPLVFKASFDKANRTRAESFRGPGLEEGLRVLEAVRQATGLPVLTDVHEPGQCAAVAGSGGRLADTRLPLSADRPAARGRGD